MCEKTRIGRSTIYRLIEDAAASRRSSSAFVLDQTPALDPIALAERTKAAIAQDDPTRHRWDRSAPFQVPAAHLAELTRPNFGALVDAETMEPARTTFSPPPPSPLQGVSMTQATT